MKNTEEIKVITLSLGLKMREDSSMEGTPNFVVFLRRGQIGGNLKRKKKKKKYAFYSIIRLVKIKLLSLKTKFFFVVNSP